MKLSSSFFDITWNAAARTVGAGSDNMSTTKS